MKATELRLSGLSFEDKKVEIYKMILESFENGFSSGEVFRVHIFENQEDFETIADGITWDSLENILSFYISDCEKVKYTDNYLDEFITVLEK